MASSKVRIISNSFILLGNSQINYLEPNNQLHDLASSLYDLLLPSILMKSPWRFPMEHRDLQRVDETPAPDWQYVFMLPEDPVLLLLYRIYPDSLYAIYGNRLHSNSEEMSADFVYQPSDSKFTPSFEALLTYKLTALLAMPITQNATLIKFWEGKAKEELMVAQQIESSQSPSIQINANDPLTLAHYT